MKELLEWIGMQVTKKGGKKEEGQEGSKKEMTSGTLMMPIDQPKEGGNSKEDKIGIIITMAGRSTKEIGEIVSSMTMESTPDPTKEGISRKIQMTNIDWIKETIFLTLFKFLSIPNDRITGIEASINIAPPPLVFLLEFFL